MLNILMRIGIQINHLILNCRRSFFYVCISSDEILDELISVLLKFFVGVLIFGFFTFHFEKGFQNFIFFIESSFLLFIRVFLELEGFFLIFLLLFFFIILDSSFVKCLKHLLSFFREFKICERISQNDKLIYMVLIFCICFFLNWIEVFLKLSLFPNLTLLTDFFQSLSDVPQIVNQPCFQIISYIAEISLLKHNLQLFSSNYWKLLFSLNFFKSFHLNY